MMNSVNQYSFRDDYSEGAHPRILEAIARYNNGQVEGYGMDPYCQEAIRLIRQETGAMKAAVHFVSGGTQANLLILSAILRPYEAVIAAGSAHISVHETGSIEATGHKIILIDTETGKLTPHLIAPILDRHQDEHRVKPKAVFISQTTECGTIYTKTELENLSRYCRKNDLWLYVDGARLGAALTSPSNDLSLQDLAQMVDVFYIGGTKNGALFGEAIVITNEALQSNFRYIMKQKGGLLAKSRFFGIQFTEMFRDGLYYELGQHANFCARELSEGLQVAGYTFDRPPASNQLFPVFPDQVIEELQNKYTFHIWGPCNKSESVVRLVTSWATSTSAIHAFLASL
ncbi:threonine aldolase family protein [Membranihabitans marinus]|nr:aminotransferase class V-fold PLP-dependent enzyme [Membranihabitans marinus]